MDTRSLTDATEHRIRRSSGWKPSLSLARTNLQAHLEKIRDLAVGTNRDDRRSDAQ